MKRNVLNSPYLSELKKGKREVFIKKTLYIIFSFLIIFVLLGFASKWNRMNIENIEITGNNVTDTDAVRELVEKEIGGHYLWLYPKTNFLFYPKSNIENRLRDEFKIFKDISINVASTKTLNIFLSERTPAYTWCGNGLPQGEEEAEQNKCYFMDESGYVFSIAPYFSGDVYFKFFGPLIGDEIMGSSFLPDIFEKIISFLDAIRKMELKPASLLALNDENLEIYLSSNTLPPDAPKIIVKRDFDVEKTAENLQTALATEPLQTDFKKKYSSLMYINLGFGNKVYFKFK